MGFQDSTNVLFVRGTKILGNTRTFGLAIADVDLDSDNDAFIADYLGNSKLWLNDGKGGFAMSDQVFDGSVHDIGLADVNGDRFPDVFLVMHDAPCRVYLSDGFGGFSDTGQNLGQDNDYPGTIAMADVDQDGDIDAFIAYYQIPNRLWLNDGNGFFTVTDTEFGAEGDPGPLSLADFNGDSYPDLFLTMSEAPDQVWMNDGSGNFRNSGQELGSSTGVDDPVSGDIDGDGDVDVIVTNPSVGIIVWLNENNTGTFIAAGDYFGNSAYTGGLCDVNMDGYVDLIARNTGGAAPEVWLNDGSGEFGSLGAVFGDIKGTLRLACGDLDGDGDPDVILGRQEEYGGNPVYLNQIPKPVNSRPTRVP
jgi:hypothetical protein